MRHHGSWFWFVCAVLMTFTLAACGGGGGDGNSSSQTQATDGGDTSGSGDTSGGMGLPSTPAWKVPADVYAPVIKVSAEMLKTDFSLGGLRRGTAPSAATIGIALPPDTKLLAAQGSIKMRSNGEETQSLPRVYLLSTTPIAEVVQFYRDNAKDFDAYEVLGTPMFIKGEFEGSPLTAMMSGLPIIQVGEVSKNWQKLWPEAVSEIQIYYEPK